MTTVGMTNRERCEESKSCTSFGIVCSVQPQAITLPPRYGTAQGLWGYSSVCIAALRSVTYKAPQQPTQSIIEMCESLQSSSVGVPQHVAQSIRAISGSQEMKWNEMTLKAARLHSSSPELNSYRTKLALQFPPLRWTLVDGVMVDTSHVTHSMTRTTGGVQDLKKSTVQLSGHNRSTAAKKVISIIDVSCCRDELSCWQKRTVQHVAGESIPPRNDGWTLVIYKHHDPCQKLSLHGIHEVDRVAW